jgi:dTDP-4-dehydrorhamnose reductase
MLIVLYGKNVDKSFIDTRLLMNYKISSYDQMIKNMIDLIKENSKLYKNYKL